VGLLPDDPAAIVPEGTPLVAEPGASPAIGHVTSSYYGARVSRSIALALLENGRERLGEAVFAALADRLIAARVTSPVFYDIAHRRRIE
jgi:sarcosine oxidase, subunit alpha